MRADEGPSVTGLVGFMSTRRHARARPSKQERDDVDAAAPRDCRVQLTPCQRRAADTAWVSPPLRPWSPCFGSGAMPAARRIPRSMLGQPLHGGGCAAIGASRQASFASELLLEVRKTLGVARPPSDLHRRRLHRRSSRVDAKAAVQRQSRASAVAATPSRRYGASPSRNRLFLTRS